MILSGPIANSMGIRIIGLKDLYFGVFHIGKTILLRHNHDVMHIEKNFFDNVFNTIMDVKGKTKDNEKARRDLELFCCRSDLHLTELPNGKWGKPSHHIIKHQFVNGLES